jgi:hypothetical protein
VDLDLAVLALRDRRVQLGFLEHRSAPSGGALRHKGTTRGDDWQVCAL